MNNTKASYRTPRPAVLCILDGWGWREDAPDNSISCAATPIWDNMLATCPHALLSASGEDVGLPDGQMGNSEVGHMTIGAGRVIFQDLPMIDRAIADGELQSNVILNELINKLKQNGGTCHLMGLTSSGGVHSHQRHIIELARIVSSAGVPVRLHCFLDGRDVSPTSGAQFVAEIIAALEKFRNARIGSLCGRYWAMDRDKRWERVERAYNLITEGNGIRSDDPIAAIEESYRNGTTDEFIEPIVMSDYEGIKDGDAVLFANFRADRAREILTALIEPDFNGFARKRKINLVATTGMVEYSDALAAKMTTIFPPKIIKDSLGELVAKAGLRQLRIAETEKYPHVTFFFNGGREEPLTGEDRIMVPSPKVATYDLAPEMAAREVTDKVVDAIKQQKFDLIVLNYANPDMVGHTGNLQAAVRAVEAIDECLGRLFAATKEAGGFVLLTADHGNCECMTDKTTGGPHTAHTVEKVPVVLINPPQGVTKLRDGTLADIAPTLLKLIGLAKPDVMESNGLIQE